MLEQFADARNYLGMHLRKTNSCVARLILLEPQSELDMMAADLWSVVKQSQNEITKRQRLDTRALTASVSVFRL